MKNASREAFHAYIRVMLGVFAVLSGGVAAINALIDPLGMVGWVELKGVNQEKPVIQSGGGRRHKASMLARGGYDTVLLGTSRTEVGIDPLSPYLGQAKAYNAGLSGANMDEIYEAFRFAMEHGHPRVVIVGLDFFSFNETQTVSGDFEESYLGGRWVLPRYLFSINTLKLSIETVRGNAQGLPSMYTRQGGSKYFLRLGKVNPRQFFLGNLRDNYLINPGTYAGLQYSGKKVALLAGMAEECARSGTRLYIFISPVHAWQLETLRLMGLYPAFEQWKRDIVGMFTELRLQQPEVRWPELWDFSGYNMFTTEEVPDGGEMQGYWESAHYKTSLGDRVLARLLATGAAKTDEGFGISLTGDNIDAELAGTRLAGGSYRAAHPEDIAELAALVARTRPVWEKKRERNVLP